MGRHLCILQRLIKYFKGGNDNKTSLELTTPTLAHLKLDKEGDGTERDYTFAYWIPPQAQVGAGW